MELLARSALESHLCSRFCLEKCRTLWENSSELAQFPMSNKSHTCSRANSRRTFSLGNPTTNNFTIKLSKHAALSMIWNNFRTLTIQKSEKKVLHNHFSVIPIRF